MGVDQADQGRSWPSAAPSRAGRGEGQAGRRPGTSQRAVGEAGRFGLDQLDGPLQVLVVVECGGGGDLGGGRDRPGLLAAAEPVDHLGRGRPRSRPGGRGTRRSWSSTGARAGSRATRRRRDHRALGLVGQERQIGLIHHRHQVGVAVDDRRAGGRGSQARPVGLFGMTGPEDPGGAVGLGLLAPSRGCARARSGRGARSGPRSAGTRRTRARPGGPAARRGRRWSQGLAAERLAVDLADQADQLGGPGADDDPVGRDAVIFRQPLDQAGRARLGVAVDGLGGRSDGRESPGREGRGRSAAPRSRRAADCPA